MTVFDGAVLITVGGDDPAARAVGEHHLAARLERGATLRTPEGSPFTGRRPLGYPPLLAHDGYDGHDGEVADPWRAPTVTRSLVAALQHAEVGPTGAHGDLLTDLAGTTTHGRWWVARACVVPPVRTGGLVAATPVVGARTHLTTSGGSVALCGRVPVRSPLGPARSADCPACLRSDTVRARVHAQLAHHTAITDHAGALTAGAAARWWPRFARLAGPADGPVGDAAVGLLHHGLPGAPDIDTALTVVADRVTDVAEVTRRWAAAEVERRLRGVLQATLPRHPRELDADLHALLATAEVLLDAATLAELLVGALEELGPAIALEPVAVRLAMAAEPTASERVRRWLRLQRVAAALGGGSTPTATLLLER